METSIRNKDQSTQREFERIGKRAVVADATAVAAPTVARPAASTGQPTPTYSLTLQYNGTNVNSNTTKIDFLDTGTFVSANITFRIVKVGSKTTVEAYGDGFLPNGTIHQTLRHTTGTAKEWIANDRLRNRGDAAHTYSASEGAIEIKSISGETGTALRVLGVAGSNVYGIYADTDNQTAIFGEATGSGYGLVGYSNTGEALLAESVTNYAVHAISQNDTIYGTSVNGWALHAVSSGNHAINAESSDANSWGVNAFNNEDFASTADGGGVNGSASGDNGVGVFGSASGSFGQGVRGEGTGDAYGLVGFNGSNNGYAASITATGTNSVGLYAEGTLYGLETTSDIAVATVYGQDYYHNGTKVIGGQGAAVADATDAASVITQLNALLARLRTHGLIAT